MIESFPWFTPIFEEIDEAYLPRIYINHPDVLSKAKKDGLITVNMQMITRKSGSASGVVIELKRIIQSSVWNTAWLVLALEAYDWYTVRNIFLEKNRNKNC